MTGHMMYWGPRHDRWKTATPPELAEVELPLCFLPEAALRRALREALKSEPEHESIPISCGNSQPVRQLMEMLLSGAYEIDLAQLTAKEIEQLDADRAEAAADWAYHHQD